jgi:hypothetical protein
MRGDGAGGVEFEAHSCAPESPTLQPLMARTGYYERAILAFTLKAIRYLRHRNAHAALFSFPPGGTGRAIFHKDSATFLPPAAVVMGSPFFS